MKETIQENYYRFILSCYQYNTGEGDNGIYDTTFTFSTKEAAIKKHKLFSSWIDKLDYYNLNQYKEKLLYPEFPIEYHDLMDYCLGYNSGYIVRITSISYFETITTSEIIDYNK